MKYVYVCVALFSNQVFAKANQGIKYVDLNSFSKMPAVIKQNVLLKNCKVPQSHFSMVPHNVVEGSFAGPQSRDWAVLCSRNGKSSIVIVWEKEKPCPSEFATADDKDFIQQINEKDFGFSRYISTSSPQVIVTHQKNCGGPLPKTVAHEGVDDAFIEKGSTTYYCESGKWSGLTGAD